MATEDELPKQMVKLEITSCLPQVKVLDRNLPLQLNPFFEFDLKDAKNGSKIERPALEKTKPLNSRLANQNCRRCRYRRASESTLDELKHTSSIGSADLDEATRTPTSGVIKQTLKRTTTSAGGISNRKVLIREPVLKALQTCLHPHSNVRRKLLATANGTKASASNEVPLTNKGMSDFRDLIDECHNLLSEDVDFSGRLNQLCLSNRNSKNFTTMQTTKTQSNKSRNNSNPIVDTAISSFPLLNKSSQSEDHPNAQTMSSMQQPVSNSSISNTLQQRNILFTPEQHTNTARHSTTCSQQAGSSPNASSCDDITIDELACYFDTLVHIPKKMSSMAEMMYI